MSRPRSDRGAPVRPRTGAHRFAWQSGLALCLLCLIQSAHAIQLFCGAPGPIEIAVPAQSTLTVQLAPSASPAWVWVEEAGQDLRLHTPDVSETLSIQVPPRFGLSLLKIDRPQEVRIERLLDHASAASVHLGLECQPSDPAVLDWLAQADDIARHLAGGLGSLRGQTVPAALDALIATAPSARWQALAMHLRAQWLLLAARSAEAVPAFTDAALRWDLIGAQAQAAAARVAAAENMRLAGRGDQALALSRASPAAPDANHYFGVRLEAARCGVLFDHGDLSDASACYDWVQQAYMQLNETLEATNVAINRADLLRRLDDHTNARSTVLAALDALQGPQSEAIRGRAELSLAETAAQQGDLSEVLLRLNAAHDSFDAAGETRWQSHVLRRLASTLLELGSLDDAQLALDAAVSLIDPTHAPLPYASAQLLQARLLRARGFTAHALALIEASIAAAETSQQQELTNLGLLELASSQLELSEPAAANLTLDRVRNASPREQARYDYLRGLSHPPPAPPPMLGQVLGRSPLTADNTAWAALSLSERVDILRSAARSAAAAGDADAALHGLLQSARPLARVSAESGNPLLGQALDALILRLRSTAIELLIQQAVDGVDLAATPDAEAMILRWLQLTLPQSGAGRPEHWSSLDSELGRLLLGEPTGRHPRALLAALSPRTSKSVAHPPPFDLGATFDARPGLLILLEGERRALRADWAPSGPRWYVIDDLMGLHRSIEYVSALARAPHEPMETLHQAATELANRLHFEVAADTGDSLDVLADGLALKVEWSLLPNSESEFLGARQRIRMLQPSLAPATTDTHEAVQLLQAAQWQNTNLIADTRSGLQLPALQAAAAEADLIRTALPGRGLDLRPLAARQTLLDAMARAGAWIHVSAHGHLQPGLLAGSGLWLNPSASGAPPQFMSALDIRRQGARAQHVVLNACQLAASTSSASQLSATHASFAHSLVLAGAEHVIAARWPVSDTATHLWVPAYYRALQLQYEAGEAFDPSAALLDARRVLQRSRAFRHPVHWAAWVHLQRMPLHAPTAIAGDTTPPRAASRKPAT